MFRIRKIVSLLVAAAALAVSTGAARAEETSLIRFVHLDAGSPTLDIYLNGELAAADISYGHVTERVKIAAGPAELSTYLPAASITLDSETISLPAGPATAVLSGTGQSHFHIVSEDLRAASFGNARLAVFNILKSEAQVTVSASDETEALAVNLAAGSASSSIETGAGTYEVRFKTDDDEMLVGRVSQPLAAGTVNLLITHGASAEPELLNAVSAAEGVADSGRLRFIHTIEGAAPVDLRFNGQLLIPALSFSAPTPHIALQSGMHDIAVHLGSAEIMSERMQIRAGEMSTVALMRTDAGLGMFHFADATADVDERSAVVNLINAIPDSVISHLQLESGAIVAMNVQSNESGDAAKIVPGRQSMSLHLNIGGEPGEVTVSPHNFHGGSHYTLIALAGSAFAAPRLLVAETSLERHIRARPAGDDIEAADAPAFDLEEAPDEPAADEPSTEPAVQAKEPETDSQEPVEEAVEEPGAEQTAEVSEPDSPSGDLPTPTGPSSTPYATVKVNPDTALHIRQYPSSDALSLGLLPAESNLMVLGRRGPSQFDPGEPTDLPIDLSGYQRDAAADLPLYQDLPAADTWLYVIYTTRDGGAIVGWTNAYYLEVFGRAGERQWLAYLPLVPQNRPGGAHNTDIQPPKLADYVAARVIGLNPDALLNLRRGNDVNSDILTLLPAETTMRTLGLDEAGAWAFVEYQPAAGNPIRGWVNMSYVQLLLNNAPVQPDALRALDPAALPVISGTAAGGVLPSTPTGPEEPIEGVVGEVNVNFDSALHLRRYPDATSESLALIPPGAILRLKGITASGGWYKVQYQDEEGWVAAPYLVLSMDGRRYPRGLLESHLPRFNDLGF